MHHLSIFESIPIEIWKKLEKFKEFSASLNWNKIFVINSVYLGALVGLYYLLTFQAKFYTYLWVFIVYMIGGIGLGPGAHRLFSHRSYKVTRPLKLFLIFCQTLTGQYSVIEWSQIHRTHHKFMDTEKDPTNINRGFWFSHFYWVYRYSPEVRQALDSIDVSDLKADKDIAFQYKYYPYLHFICCMFIPTIVPYVMWQEAFWISFWANVWRMFLNLSQMSVGNSVMHMYGTKPYDKNLTAAENIFSILWTFGEGYHNYHHVFPWDYKAAEFGDILHFNISSVLIDCCAKLGMVYDRKVVTESMIERRKARTGDGTHWLTSEINLENLVWGYGDPDMDIEDKIELNKS